MEKSESRALVMQGIAMAGVFVLIGIVIGWLLF